MSDYAHASTPVYGQADLSAKLLTALREAGKDLEALTRDDLASFDEQHGGGRDATRELARLTGLRTDMHVLDVGSGLGGPAQCPRRLERVDGGQLHLHERAHDRRTPGRTGRRPGALP